MNRAQFVAHFVDTYGASLEDADQAWRASEYAQQPQEDPMTEIEETISTETNGHTEKRRPRAPKPVIEQGESANLAMQMREIKKQAAARRMVLLRELKELEDEFGKALIDESPPAKPRASKPPIAKAKAAPAASDDVRDLVGKIVLLCRESEKALRSEEIRKELDCDKSLLAKALKLAVADGTLVTAGHKRSTTYTTK